MAEATYKTRHRINISTSVKGVITPEVTVELIDDTEGLLIIQAKDLYEKAQKLCAELQGPVA
tara:strand:+ start:242 stop:427 length:186 start_codon:yes stop_codon:yes gene_type:complete